MRVSLNQIKQYINFELPPVDELVSMINQQLGSVEEVTDLGVKYKDALIVVVAKSEKHPNADRLSVCLIDDGGVVENVERDEDNLIKVVCGAPNVRGGMMTVWLPPKSIVPSTFDDKDPFVLATKELRGVMSNGMLAASDELALGSDHEGIIEITEGDFIATNQYSDDLIGKSFAKVFGLDDTVIDIENKMFTHRPDCFGQIGVAREISGIVGHEFIEKDWYWGREQFSHAAGLELNVFNDAQEKVPRFMAVAMKNIDVKPSPLWLQCALVAMGSKSINNIVDVTNYVMLLTAQPVHAYDYDKLRGHKLGTRFAKNGEKITLLNHKEYILSETDIVIVDGEGPVGLAGVMGGGESEVSNDTKNIVLEVANFDMYAVRKSSMRHGLFTDAVTRFNKGQSPLQNDRILNLLMMSVKDVSPNSEQASDVFDDMNPRLKTQHDDQSLSGTIKIEATFINERLGLNLSSDEIEQLLRNVRFACFVDEEAGDSAISITAPFWRTDIELPEDVVEEVGRLYGFDKLPRELPVRSMKPAHKNQRLETKQLIRENFAKFGVNEVLTYSFVHENIMKKSEQDVSQAFRLSNALSPDLQYYRLSVLPSLLDKVHANVKAGYYEFALFEIGKGHNKKFHESDDDGLPAEMEFVDFVYTSKQTAQSAPFYTAKQHVVTMLKQLGINNVRYKVIESKLVFPVTAPFDLSRSVLVETADGEFIGMVGELKQSVRKQFKLPAHTSAATLDFGGIHTARLKVTNRYRPLSKYPSVKQDVSLKVSSDTQYQVIEEAAKRAVEAVALELNWALIPLSIYQADDDMATKTITLRLTVHSSEKTLTDEEVAKLIEAVADASKSTFGAERI